MTAAANCGITHEELLRVLSYDDATGEIRWRINAARRSKAGSLAGGVDGNGYIAIKYLGRIYRAHRLAWFYVHGQWPANQIDHMNGERTDNRIANLRDVRPVVNSQNYRGAMPKNTTGLLGVSLERGIRYSAKIFVHGKRLHLGIFPTAEEAHAAYLNAKRQMHEGCQI